ncbi:MAG: hypothetical protein R8K20_08185, partial [Gallionellaceae bacterium]
KVWVVSKYLDHDDPAAHLNEGIKKNVSEYGLEYKYIVPNINDQALKEKSERIYKFFTSKLNRECPFLFLKEEAFDYPCDLLIFNPDLLHESDIIVFMELKVAKDAKERKWARIENSSARRIFESIQLDINNPQNVVALEDSILKCLIVP